MPRGIEIGVRFPSSHEMKDIEDKELDEALADIITGRPHEIEIGRKTLRLYPVTLAKTFLLRRWMGKLKIDYGILKSMPQLECLRLAETQPEVVAEILAIHSAPNSAQALHDSHATKIRRDLLLSVKPEHLAGLLMTVLTEDKTDVLSSYLGMTAERDRLQEVLAVKRAHDKNNLSFGGKSILGLFIGPLKEMGYTDEDILFKYGYSYLRLMLADKVTSVYVSDKELESLSQGAGGTLLDGEDDGDLDALAALIKAGGEKKGKR